MLEIWGTETNLEARYSKQIGRCESSIHQRPKQIQSLPHPALINTPYQVTMYINVCSIHLLGNARCVPFVVGKDGGRNDVFGAVVLPFRFFGPKRFWRFLSQNVQTEWTLLFLCSKIFKCVPWRDGTHFDMKIRSIRFDNGFGLDEGGWWVWYCTRLILLGSNWWC